jgi:ribosomal protein L40E
LRYAIRSFLRTPTATVVVLITMACGIGATTAILARQCRTCGTTPIPRRRPIGSAGEYEARAGWVEPVRVGTTD